jgi:hypothetical protein
MIEKKKIKPVTEYQDNQCKLFAKYSVKTSLSHYSKTRNQGDMQKVRDDIYRGKKAEFMVYNTLKDKYDSVTAPDVEIYSSGGKSFDSDMIVTKGDKELKLHIKSHEANNRFPVSWVFHNTDPLILNRPKGNYLVLVVLNEEDEDDYMYICNIRDKGVKFGKPMRDNLKSSKACIYEQIFMDF